MRLFSEFFKEWLYSEQGYYANIEQIGKEGDFYTAVSASSFFGGAIANHIYKEIESGILDRESAIVEIGADRGYLMADIIQFLYTFNPKLLETLRFIIIEPLEHLKTKQIQYLRESFGDAIKLEHCHDLSELKESSIFAYANELFDAFPCELIYDGKVAFEEDFKIEFLESNSEILEVAKKYNISKGEIPLGIYDFAKKLFDCGEKVEFITFDYGKEMHRGDFNIRTYKEHKTLPLFDEQSNLKELFGTSDITYDVFFGFVIDEFKRAGFHADKLKKQNSALIDFGLMDLLEILQQNVDQTHFLREVNKIKTLIDPDFMGDRFKMARFLKI